ncbi:GFA family protein [Epibacterium ulvae]|uniref:GFA family protein n=1 Tax=Epibacterium ulvae TaxID=1156985 RepID=UPI001BFC3C27|nr:GFA family protein [Epibacterium ulvae]MBT8154597.1 GFA family protein [Epibacterium ulvae]
MQHPKPPFSGACLCGAAQVRVTAEPLLTLACHCRDCQKLSASAFSLTVMVPQDSFTCSGDLIVGGRKSDGRVHYFCASCLNFVYSQIGTGSGRINLRSSVLKEAALFAPFVELMTEEKQPWVSLPVQHSFARYPESAAQVQDLLEAYRDR